MSAQTNVIVPGYQQNANSNRQIVVPTRYSVVKAAVLPLRAERATWGNQNIEYATAAAIMGRESHITS